MADYKNEFGWFAPKPTVEKKIYSLKAVAVGLGIFLVVFGAPLLLNMGQVHPVPQPSLDTPAIQRLAEKERQCVEPPEWMRANHMQLLWDWREQVVRTGERYYTTSQGKKVLASLSNNCMECHSNKSHFCDQCHNYVAVAPNCWGCHLPKEQNVAKAEGK